MEDTTQIFEYMHLHCIIALNSMCTMHAIQSTCRISIFPFETFILEGGRQGGNSWKKSNL